MRSGFRLPIEACRLSCLTISAWACLRRACCALHALHMMLWAVEVSREALEVPSIKVSSAIMGRPCDESRTSA